MEPNSQEEKTPFLESHHASTRSSSKYSTEFKCGRVSTLAVIVLSILLLFSNSGWLALYMRVSSSCVRPQLIYSPAIESIAYERVELHRSIEPDNIYTGEPRPEHDNAWIELIKPLAIKISANELRQLGEQSIAFKDGSGYLAEMAVFHELHCIKRIRRHLHLDYYYKNMTEDEQHREKLHMDHCLEYWREAAMCRGDPTLATFVWHEERPFSKQYSVHECVNWDKLWKWAQSRMVDTSDLTIFM
ncbi:hypothetical protein F5Y16DRAFT_380994 [Xylariaceae sp. FL0255]|nr:hypothetical protein F5Y16DRAFT_380994 [Xylariaceae sp. FL0255]